MLLIFSRPPAAPALLLAKARAPEARSPKVGERIEFLSDALTDKGPATGEIVGVKITVDGLYVTVKFADSQQSFSWDDLDKAGADVRGGLWMVKAHPALQPQPSPAQIKAGNAPKRREEWRGLTLRIENEAGSVRTGPGWETRMLFPYGEVEDSEGSDGDRVDVYLGPYMDTAAFVYIVHQRRFGRWDQYDEDKCMLGFLSEEEAAIAYLKHYDDPRFLGPITTMPVDEFVAKVLATRDAPGMIKASWFGDADMLKATLKKTITVPGYVKADGTVVPPHQKAVHYNPDHNLEHIAAGGVSHSQKQAHKDLAQHDWFHKLDTFEQASHVMALATDKQDAASASAAVSGWKAAAKAGKNPTGAQWAAFQGMPKEKQAALYDEVKAAAGLSHLSPPAAPVVHEPKVIEPAPQQAPAPTPAPAPADPEDATDYDALLSKIPSTGSHYQKEAHKKLSADPAWQAKSHKEKHADVMATYKQLQGAASQAAAVSMWKKSMLAGKVPSPAQHAAFLAMQKQDTQKAWKVYDEVKAVIGADKAMTLLGQSGAKDAPEGKPAPAPVAKAPATPPAPTPAPTPAPSSAPAPAAAGFPGPALPKGWKFDPSNMGLSDMPALEIDSIGGSSYGAYVAQVEDGGVEIGLTDDFGEVLGAKVFTDQNQAAAWLNSQMAVHAGDDMSQQLQPAHIAAIKGYGKSAAAPDGVDGWKASLLAGKHPTKEQWAAYEALSDSPKHTALGTVVSSAMDAVSYAMMMAHLSANKEGKTPTSGLSAAEVKAAMLKTGVLGNNMVMDAVKLAAVGDVATLKGLKASIPKAKVKTVGFVAELIAQLEAGKAPRAAAPAPVAPPPPAPVPPAAPKMTQVFAPKSIYHNTTAGHNKEWSVHVVGNKLVTEYGAIGAKQQKTEKEFGSHDAALLAASKLKKEKLAKGYVLVGHDQHHKATMPLPGGPAGGPPVKPVLPASTFSVAATAVQKALAEKNPDPIVQELKLAHGLTSPPAQQLQGYAIAALKHLGQAKPDFVTQHQWDGGALADQGPKDGDTKQGADGTLVFKDGHWHKVPGAPAGAQAAPAKKLSQAKISTVVKRALQPFNVKYLAGNGAQHAAQAKAMANAGDLAGLQALKAKLNLSTAPKLMAVFDALINAMGGDPGGVAAAGPAVAASKAAPQAKPAASPIPAPSPVNAPAVPATKSGEPQEIDSWQKVGEKMGSNPGGSFKDKSGKTWYCKFPASEHIARNEVLAIKFYQMLGMKVPNLKLIKKGGKVGIASAWVDGLKVTDAASLAKAKGAHDGFVLDAWLGNWDVVGMSNDNLKVDPQGNAVRVDAGGSLLYRAQGGKKGDDDFSREVKEFDSMLDPSKNPKAAAVFAGISKQSLLNGAKQLNKLKPSQIRELVDKIGPGTEKDKAKLASTLIARRAAILNKFGLADQWAKKDVDETAVPVDPKILPKPLDFNTINHGKPLSSKAHVNEMNSKDSAALVKFASKGNLKALKDYHYDAIDKESGALKGKKPITDHPSNQIQQQWASLVQTLQSIAYPPVEALDMPPLGLAGTLDEVAASAGSFAPQHNVTTVPAEHRFGYFMNLGNIGDAEAKEFVADLVKKEHYIPQDHAHSFIQKGKAHYQKGSAVTKEYTSGVQGSGSVNHIWSQGKKSWNGKSINAITKAVYDDAMEVPEGMVLTRWMDDDTAGDLMTQQFQKSGPGAMLQNTDSMCASMWKSWQGGPKFCTEPKKAIMMKIRCAKGAKVTPSYGSGSHWGEGELTTLPGARFMVVDVKKGGATHPDGIIVECIMLPPDPGFVSQLAESPLKKSFEGAESCPPSSRTVFLLGRFPTLRLMATSAIQRLSRA